MNILSIGQFSADGLSNTCLHRNWALHKLADVDDIDSYIPFNKLLFRVLYKLFLLGLPIKYPVGKFNKSIISATKNKTYNAVWIDKGVFIKKKTLIEIKKKNPGCVIIGYSPDNMVERHNQSQHFIDTLPLYDHFVTTKSYTVDKLKEMGANDVIFVNNAYEDTFHHPYDLTSEDKSRLGGLVGFIGMWEKERCDSIIYLAQNGIPVRVWGAGRWLEYKGKYPNLIIEDKALFSEDYNKALSAFDISLCFLRKMNFDQQTTRTMEIPACKSLLMAERTNEHQALFEEGKEAVFFSHNEELLEKCQYYLSHPKEMENIKNAGYERCIKSGYSNFNMVKGILKKTGVL